MATCNDCGEPESHAPNCIRLREREYKRPKSWKEITAKRNISAPVDFECEAGRRHEGKDKLR